MKEEIKTILQEHKIWVESNGVEGKKANLRGADLSVADLSKADLRGADLSVADLSKADLRYADLSGANLRGADLSKADLSGANLRGADLSGAYLSGAYLSGANLRGANLRGADIDFSAFPLWCGGLNLNIDDRLATQLLYHLVRNVRYSENTSKHMKKICSLKSVIKQANKFHRVKECGKIEELQNER